MMIKFISEKYGLNAAGFTLIELLIAVFLAAVVATAAMGIYVAQHQQLIAEDELIDMRANARAAAVELATKIRMAGYNVPQGIPKLQASNTDPDTITITFDSGGFENVTVEHPVHEPYEELRCDGHDISALHDGDWAFIYDPVTQNGEFFLVTEIDVASARIRHDTMPLSRVYPTGSRVIMMSQFKYYIDSSESDHPKLMCWTHRTGPQVFAENISDLNFRYVLTGGQKVDIFPGEETVREVIIALGTYTGMPDGDIHSNYRTGELETMVKVRNLGS